MYLEQVRQSMLYLQDMLSDAADTDSLYPEDLLQSVDVLANITEHLAQVDKECVNGAENLTMTAEVGLIVDHSLSQ